MKLISWNVNGIRAAVNKGFKDFFVKENADIFCIQETKLQENQIDADMKKLTEYNYWNSAVKKGYSGTATFSKIKPILVTYGDDDEGRVITCEYENFYLVNCYTPNSKRELERLDFRMKWEDKIKEYLKELDKKKPVIYCGDLKNPSSNHHNAGFTDEERDKIDKLLKDGFVDTFRYKYPNKKDAYTWWSYMFHAREKNAGWRIDYFIVSDRIKDKIVDAKIHSEVLGSDHCPIELEIELS